ncbi:MAG: hypothetical protein DWQ31_18950 [Planctomycetota bacterium]|nr:MAG: hypothetical protein DWQ31_18950 [Planctomycetota bacterium]REJ93167.1 MAG: hypothetical protein DWQ35_10835 [Planctomycetota bacterium]REK23352.1 MAG: hypothetical protein DWQ42_15420 [Planctomycetota bacterium]REK47155.1 MAG: hypothetical protein DWQ46_04800 [Planctomycetota bacterium]
MSSNSPQFEPGILPPLAESDEWLVASQAFARFERRMERRLATLEKRWISFAAPAAARTSMRIQSDYGVVRRDLNRT